jgi:DNA modification methylase
MKPEIITYPLGDHPPEAHLYYGIDALEGLRLLPDESIQCCVTSPPYFGLRSYLVEGQLGLEPTPEEYVARLKAVFLEVKRVLRSDGTLFLNLADTYTGFYSTPGMRLKDLLGIPWRVAFALQADGWYLRDAIIWLKENPMTESAKDRCTSSYEFVFLLTKSSEYFWDWVAIAEPLKDGPSGETKNRRNVWTFPVKHLRVAHSAVMPEGLAERCVLVGSSAKGACPKCGAF